MKSKLFFLASLLLINISTSAQITFQKSYGSFYGDEFGNSIQQTSDKGFIICGYSSNITDTTYLDAYLVRTDSLGDTLWSRRFGTRSGMIIGVEIGFQVKQTFDNGFIIVGQLSIQLQGNSSDVYLIKTDSTGNLSWSKTYGGAQDDIGYSVEETLDHGFIITGATASFGTNRVYLIKTDNVGNELWSKTYNSGNTSWGKSVKQTLDGGYIICGISHSDFRGLDTYLIKTDNLGNYIWSKIFGGLGDEGGQSVFQTLDSGFVISGSTKSFGAGNSDAYLIKTNDAGNMIWSKTYGNTSNESCGSAMPTNDGGYILAGVTHSVPNNGQVYIVRVDNFGTLLWSKIFEQTYFNATSFAVETMDGGFIIISTGITTTSLILIKTDAIGISCANYNSFLTIENSPPMEDITATTIIDSTTTITSFPDTYSRSVGGYTKICSGTSTEISETPNENEILISPNPFYNSFYYSGSRKDGVILIFDLVGKEIDRYNISNVKTEINTTLLKPGFYILKYISENKTTSFKLEKL